MNRLVSQLLSTRRRIMAFVGVIYFLSTFFSASMKELLPLPGGGFHWQYGKNNYGIISLPRILRGDEMHYLLMANSLALDGDLRLSRDYTSVQQGGLEMGVYHRHKPAKNFLQHFSRRGDGTLVGKHPVGLSAVLAWVLWPVAGTVWMEAACIWFTMLVGLAGIRLVMVVLEQLGTPFGTARIIALLTAFATPWWSYSRTLYTEVWIGTGLLALMAASLRNRTPGTLPLAALLAWFKYPALLLFFSAGVADLIQGRRKRFLLWGINGAVVLAVIMMFNSWFFAGTSWVTRDADIASLTDKAPKPAVTAVRVGGSPIGWVPGKIGSNIRRIFNDPDKGLIIPTPLLLLALGGLYAGWRMDRQRLLVLLAFILPWALLHLSYRWLMSGASYTTRYLVPVVPLLMIALVWYRQRWGASRTPVVLFWVAAAFSLATNIVAGVFPAAAFDSDPFEIWSEGIRIIWYAFVPWR